MFSTSQALLDRAKAALELTLPGVQVQLNLDVAGDGYPTLRATRNGDALFVKLITRGNASRIDGTNAPQAAYAPHAAQIVRRPWVDGQYTLQLQGIVAGRTVTTTINGVSTAAVPFNTNNNTTVADVATALSAPAFAGLLTAAVASTDTITITPVAGKVLNISALFGGTGGTPTATVANPVAPSDSQLREFLLAAVVGLGARTDIYEAAAIGPTFSLSGASLIYSIPSNARFRLELSA